MPCRVAWCLVAFFAAGGCLLPAARAAEIFGRTADGQPVEQFTLTNGNGLSVTLISRGATITRLLVPDREGKLADVVLGFDDVAGYESDRNQYFGCIVGRVANRIARGKFELAGKTYTLAINNDPNHLHGGGPKALDKVLWKGEKIQTLRGPAVRFTYTSPDGEEGYPGKVAFTVTYSLTERNAVWVQMEAETDQATPVNLSQHTYFNLAGHGAATALDHELTLFADRYTPVDETLIPTGQIETVAGTPLDFRPPAANDDSAPAKAHTIGERIEKLVDTPTRGYDHNFVLNADQRGRLAKAAVLREPRSGRTLTVLTSQPGMQLYTGNFLFGQQGKDGQKYAQRSAVCLETQHFPDAVNQQGFASVILRPGQKYAHTCVYAFSAE